MPVLAVAALVAAPAASADNQSFVDALTAQGFTSAESYLATGKVACSALKPQAGLMFGRHPNLVAEMVWTANPSLERPQAAQIVNAAIDNLCPGVNAFGYAAV